MLNSRKKISLRQAMVLFLVATSSPSMTNVPNATAATAHQAAWLSPIVSFIIIIPIIFIYKSIFTTYKEESFAEVIEDILGSFLGKIIAVMYIAFLTILLSIVLRHFAENIVSTIFPNENILVFMIAIIFTVAVILRRGLVVLARMGEIILIFLIVIFLAISTFGAKDIEISRLTPISYLDFLPILGASTAIVPVFSLFSYTFLLSNHINDKEKIAKVCTRAFLLLTFLMSIVLIMTIGILGDSTVALTSNPYILTVKQISIFEAIERIEASVVNMWIVSDFVIISMITFAVHNMIKSVFKLSDTKNFISIYLVIIFFIGSLIANNSFELQTFEQFLLPVEIFWAYILPGFVFIIGKIRKKI